MKKEFIIYLLLLLYSCSDFKNTDLSGDVLKSNDRSEKISNLISNTDTSKINALVKLGLDLSQNNPDSAIGILNRALVLSAHIQYNYGIARALHVLGVCQFNQRDLQKSKSSFFKAIDHYEHHYEQSETTQKYISTVYSNLGNVFIALGVADSALYYYNKSLSLIDKVEDMQFRKVHIYNGISASFLMVGQKERAWHYLSLATKHAEQLQSYKELAYLYARKADLFESQNPDSSMVYRKMSIELYRKDSHKVNLQEAFSSIGKMWIVKKNADSAQYYFNLADNVIKSIPPERYQINALLNRGDLFMLKKQHKKALEKYKEIELKLQGNGMGDNMLNQYSVLVVYKSLALIYNNLNENLLAYKYEKQYNELKDSIFKQEKLAAVNRLETQFSLAEKNRDLLAKELFITKQNSKIQKQYLGISFAVILILLLLIILYRRKHKLSLMGIKSKLAGAEQERLRLAQEIHDGIVSKLTAIKMNFNALPDYTNEQLSMQFNETLKHLDDSITELRQTTHNLHPALLQRVGLVNALNNYSAQINAGGLIGLKIDVDGAFPSFSSSAELHLFRILQELIQNIIKHAEASEVILKLNNEADQLRISIRDNGKGMDHEELANNDSIGLSNLRDRIQLLQGTMKVQNISEGTIVYLTFFTKNLNEKTYEHKDFYSR